MAVPYTFGSATTSIPLSQLDSNFATTITLGNTAIQLGNTVTTLNNMTLGNVTVSSGNVVAGIASGTITQAMLGTNVAGNGPAFSAYLNSAQTVSNNTLTKLSANIEEFDTNSNYDNATNYRFTPTISGYYQINGNITFAATAINGNSVAVIYKNGARFKDGNLSGGSTAGSLFYSVVSALIYFNGSTDYVELWGLVNGTGTLTFGVNNGTQSYFQGVLVRSA
jgi:hypothetical protein